MLPIRRTTSLLPYAIGAGLMASGIAFAAPLDVKTGLWENTIEHWSSGTIPIPKEIMDKLTPEQRAKMQGSPRQMPNQGPHTEVHRQCLKKEDLDKPIITPSERDKNCKQNVVSQTSRHAEYTMLCSEKGNQSSGHVLVDAADSEHIKGTIDVKIGPSDQGMTIHADIRGKWLSSDCGSVTSDVVIKK